MKTDERNGAIVVDEDRCTLLENTGKHRYLFVHDGYQFFILFPLVVRCDLCHQALITKDSRKYLDVYLDKWLARKTRIKIKEGKAKFETRRTENTGL